MLSLCDGDAWVIVDTKVNVSSIADEASSLIQGLLLGGVETWHVLPDSSCFLFERHFCLSCLPLDCSWFDLTLLWPKFVDCAQSTSVFSYKVAGFPEKEHMTTVISNAALAAFRFLRSDGNGENKQLRVEIKYLKKDCLS